MNIAIILIILLAGAVVTYLSGNRFAQKVALLFSVASAVFAVALLLQYFQSGEGNFVMQWISKPYINFSLRADSLSLLMLLMTTFLVPVILMSSSADKMKSEKTFYALILFNVFAIAGVFMSSNALIYYIFWELSLIPIYFITLFWGNGDIEKRKKATLTFFIYTFAGSMFMLAAIIYMYTKVGSFELDAFYGANLSSTEQIWIYLAFFLAYAIKIPIFPFHTWQADVYEKSPYSGTMILAGLMSKMGLFSILRWQLPTAPDAALQLRPVVLVLCIIGVIYGAIIALRQENLKRFMAYASLSHVGMVAAGIYSGTYDGLEGAIFLMLAHSFGIVGLFFAVEVINRRRGTMEIKALGGIKAQAPKFATAFMLMLLASIALPLTLNFLGEFTIMLGLFRINIWYAILIGTSMFLGAFFMLRMYQQVMLGEPDKSKPFGDLTMGEGFVFGLITLVVFFFGIYSTPISNILSPYLHQILVYIN
ncbi:NuoM family protein [Dysgonomonas sp. 25]|uniref:complex I subunit 4 family protein n=1 Tax=Dysgonomonas sp. 25 TaxID=2302933 RepID=UPI0013D6EA25|nr:NADH-quinone oxidoreductase subunit M [Dysgonomonas sp. 25]NDV69876.1 NADH-quinone oxidoreductase subunit M [Dysgonomonas sp. 25]